MPGLVSRLGGWTPAEKSPVSKLWTAASVPQGGTRVEAGAAPTGCVPTSHGVTLGHTADAGSPASVSPPSTSVPVTWRCCALWGCHTQQSRVLGKPVVPVHLELTQYWPVVFYRDLGGARLTLGVPGKPPVARRRIPQCAEIASALRTRSGGRSRAEAGAVDHVGLPC